MHLFSLKGTVVHLLCCNLMQYIENFLLRKMFLKKSCYCIRMLVSLELFQWDVLTIYHTETTVSCLLFANRKNTMHCIKVEKKKSFTRQMENKGVTLAKSRKISVLCKEGLTIKDALMPLSKSGFVFHVRGSELMHIAEMFLQNTNASSRAQCVKGRPIFPL